MVRYNAIASRQMETAMTDPNRITAVLFAANPGHRHAGAAGGTGSAL